MPAIDLHWQCCYWAGLWVRVVGQGGTGVQRQEEQQQGGWVWLGGEEGLGQRG